jgi:hypothetical protein
MSDIVDRRAPLPVGEESHPVHEPAQNGAGEPFTLDNLPLHIAKAQLGGAVKTALRRTDSVLKEFGTPAVVDRMCRGEVSDVLGRIWARPDTREEFLLALMKASGLYDVRHIAERRKA